MGSVDQEHAASPPPSSGSWIHSPSDAELITAVRGGDRSAFGTLHTRHVAAATTLARQLARSSAEVDDLVSTAFARLLEALTAGHGPDSAFRIHLFTELRRAACAPTDATLRSEGDTGAPGSAESADDVAIVQPRSSPLARAFGSLPERWQAALWHTQMERESPQQVAVLVGLSPNGVTSLSSRAHQALREAYLQAYRAETAAEQCRTTARRLGAEGRSASPERDAAQVAAHVAECSGCRTLDADLSALDHRLRGVLALAVLGDAAAGYLAWADAATTAPHAAEMTDEAADAAANAAETAAGSRASAAAGLPAAAEPESSPPAEPGSADRAPSPTAAAWWTRPRLIAVTGTGVAAVVAAVAIWSAAGADDPGKSIASAAPVSAASASSMTPPSPAAPSSTHPVRTASTDPASATSAFASTSATAAATDLTEETNIPTGLTGAAGIATGTSPTAGTSLSASTSPTASTSPGPGSGSPEATPGTAAPPKPNAPPATTLTSPVFTIAAIAATVGGTATATFTVTNTAASASSSRASTITFPGGMSLADVTIAVGPARSALRPASVPALEAIRPAARHAAIVRCVGNSCTYTVPPASRVAITLHIALGADARSGNLVLRTPGTAAAVVRIAVQRPVTSGATTTTSATAGAAATTSAGATPTGGTPASTSGAVELETDRPGHVRHAAPPPTSAGLQYCCL